MYIVCAVVFHKMSDAVECAHSIHCDGFHLLPARKFDHDLVHRQRMASLWLYKQKDVKKKFYQELVWRNSISTSVTLIQRTQSNTVNQLVFWGISGEYINFGCIFVATFLSSGNMVYRNKKGRGCAAEMTFINQYFQLIVTYQSVIIPIISKQKLCDLSFKRPQAPEMLTPAINNQSSVCLELWHTRYMVFRIQGKENQIFFKSMTRIQTQQTWWRCLLRCSNEKASSSPLVTSCAKERFSWPRDLVTLSRLAEETLRGDVINVSKDNLAPA